MNIAVKFLLECIALAIQRRSGRGGVGGAGRVGGASRGGGRGGGAARPRRAARTGIRKMDSNAGDKIRYDYVTALYIRAEKEGLVVTHSETTHHHEVGPNNEQRNSVEYICDEEKTHAFGKTLKIAKQMAAKHMLTALNARKWH